jgi:hypothetical protein
LRSDNQKGYRPILGKHFPARGKHFSALEKKSAAGWQAGAARRAKRET